MSESLTEGAVQEPASIEPTGNEEQQQNSAESQGQEAISGEQSQEAVASEEAKNNNSGAQAADDSLAKFAKSQGIEDVSTLSEREQKLLKIARDNQRSYRQASENSKVKVEDAAKNLQDPGPDATELQKLTAKVQQFEYKTKTDTFWSQENVDRSLEPKMVEVLNDKREQFGKDYAFALSQDLDTLYAMAQLKSGAIDVNAAKEEGRREERDSIRQKTSASAPPAHAVNKSGGSAPKIDRQWIKDTYQPGNKEHEALFQEALARGDLY
jgi:hypothetical protein